jgi:hypothetical protein
MAGVDLITKINSLKSDIEDTNFANNYQSQFSYLDKLNIDVKDNYDANVILSSELTNTIGSLKGHFDERIKKIDDISQRKLEISRFYTLKYRKEISILQKIVFICGIGLIGCLLFNIGLISNNFLSLYLGIVLAIGFVIVFYGLWDVYIRDNNDFDEYNYGVYGSTMGTVIPSNSGKYNKHELSNLKC